MEKKWIPKTITEWIVFIVINMTALTGAFKIGIELKDAYFGESEESRMEERIQNNLWIKNKDCYRDTKPYVFTTERSENLSIVICKSSGDIYFELVPRNSINEMVHKWIEIPRKEPLSFFLFTELKANEATILNQRSFSEKEILCRKINETYIVEIRKLSDNSCHKVIKWFNGKIETSDIKCTSVCEEK